MIPTKKLGLTIAETMRAVPIGRSSLYEEIAAGRLPAHKLGRRTLIMANDLQQWLDSLPRVKPSKKPEA